MKNAFLLISGIYNNFYRSFSATAMKNDTLKSSVFPSKRMQLLLFAFVLIFVSCKNETSDSGCTKPVKDNISYNEPDIYRTLFPHSAKDVVSTHIITQIYEGLVKYNPRSLVVEPAIAEKWSVDETGTEYIFNIRDSVFFHDDACFPGGKGRVITAEDIKFSFYLLCTKNAENFNFFGTLDKIKGAKEYYLQSDSLVETSQIEGIQVLNDKEIKIILENENPLFIYFLANPAAVIVPREAFEKYGYKCSVGSGPYKVLQLAENNNPLKLIKNQYYYKKDSTGCSLPYIDSVYISFNGSIQKELKLFEEGKIDFIAGLSESNVPGFLEKNIAKFESNPPEYVLNQSEEEAETGIYNLTRSYVNGFYSNRMNFIDLSLIFFNIPEKIVTEKAENK